MDRELIQDIFEPSRRKQVLTLVIWFLIPVPNSAGILYPDVSWLPIIAPLSLLFGMFSWLLNFSGFQRPIGGWDSVDPFYVEMYLIGFGSLLLAYITASLIVWHNPDFSLLSREKNGENSVIPT